MKTVNVAELEGAALDWAVAKAVGIIDRAKVEPINLLSGVNLAPFVILVNGSHYAPSTDWSQCGPLIESLEFGLAKESDESWVAIRDMDHFEIISEYPGGPTPLIAACRAIVAAKFGDTVEVPEELL